MINQLVGRLNSIKIVAWRDERRLLIFDHLSQSVHFLDVRLLVDSRRHCVQFLDQGHQDGALRSAGRLDKLVVFRFFAHAGRLLKIYILKKFIQKSSFDEKLQIQ